MTTRLSGNTSFPKRSRLITAADYRAVFKAPKRVSTAEILFLFCKSVNGTSRLGLAIAKKQIPRAVDRNRIKRLIREAFRHKKSQLYSTDIVVIARKSLLNMDNTQVRRQLDKLLSKVILKGKAL